MTTQQRTPSRGPASLKELSNRAGSWVHSVDLGERGPVVGRIKSAIVACLVLVTAIGVAVGQSGTAPSRILLAGESGRGPGVVACAWPIAVNARTLASDPSLNIHNPDTNSDYWIMAITFEPSLRITLTGRFPQSRYMSVSVYDSQGAPFVTNGVSSTLTDFQIKSARGEVNPWRRRTSARNFYAISLTSDPRADSRNALPLAPEGTAPGTSGLLFYRVYAPASDDPGRVAVPKVTMNEGGSNTHLAACKGMAAMQSEAAQVRQDLGLSPAAAKPARPSAPPPIQPGEIVPFVLGAAALGSTPNTDSRYLYASYVPPANQADVLVIHGKAPTTPSGSGPAPWPARGIELRYWSFCNDLLAAPQPVVVNRLVRGRPDYGCRDDNQIAVDKLGDYTVVVGRESQRSQIERVPNVTFIPLSQSKPDQAYKINLRNMLPNQDFAQAVQRVPPDNVPTSAAVVMGPYYPRAVFCSLRVLIVNGPGSCLSSRQ